MLFCIQNSNLGMDVRTINTILLEYSLTRKDITEAAKHWIVWKFFVALSYLVILGLSIDMFINNMQAAPSKGEEGFEWFFIILLLAIIFSLVPFWLLSIVLKFPVSLMGRRFYNHSTKKGTNYRLSYDINEEFFIVNEDKRVNFKEISTVISTKKNYLFYLRDKRKVKMFFIPKEQPDDPYHTENVEILLENVRKKISVKQASAIYERMT